MRYVAAAVQFEPVPARPDLNVPRLLALIDEAATRGARLIVLPEMATVGYCFADRREVSTLVEPVPGPLTRQLEVAAARHDCVIVCGVGEVDAETQLYYNTAVVVGPQGYIGKYRKTHFFSADAKWAVEGDLGLPVWDTPVGRLGVAVCMDATYPEVGRALALQGAQVICFPTNWVGSPPPDHRWLSQAFENGVYWIAANRCGWERGLQFQGGSCIVDPKGAVQRLASDEDDVIYGEIDLERTATRQFRADREEDKLADRRPELYREMLRAPYTWSPTYYHSLYGAPGLPEPRRSRIAAVQWTATGLHRAADPEEIRALVPKGGLDLIVLPELLCSTRSPHDAGAQQGLHDVDRLMVLAAACDCLVAGTVVERAGHELYHTAVLCDANGTLGTHRKCHLTSEERDWATAGVGPFGTIDTPIGRIGLAPGYDAGFFETLRVLATQGADLVCVSANLPWSLSRRIPDSDRTWSFWRSKAWESCIALAVANFAEAGCTAGTGIWVPDVRDDRSRESVTVTDGAEVVAAPLDTGARYLREKRGMGWRRLQWYTPLVR